MNLSLAFIAVLILGSATVAIALRNLIHSALLLVVSWTGVAGFYLWAGAEFVAFAQVLVYVGAISMVVLFAVLLTRRARVELILPMSSLSRVTAGVVAGLAVFGVLAAAVLHTPSAVAAPEHAPEVTVRMLGIQLMSSHSAAVLVIGVLLTVSLLGAIVLAATDDPKKGDAP